MRFDIKNLVNVAYLKGRGVLVLEYPNRERVIRIGEVEGVWLGRELVRAVRDRFGDYLNLSVYP